MPIKKKEKELDFNNLFDNFLKDVTEKLDEDTGGDLNIIEFVYQELDLGIELTPQQTLVLKAAYGIPLTEEEESILEYWQAINRCHWHGDRNYQLLIFEVGRRAGKTTISSIIAVYEFYKLCRLASPQKFFKISKSSFISILVLATTAEQAKRAIFAGVTGVVQNCKYFKRLEEQGKLFIQKESIEYPEKMIGIFSGNSQSASQVGSNILVLIMDEVARFKDLEGKSNAITLWSNIGISTAVFGSHSKRIAISSAWFRGDAIEELFLTTGEDKTAFGIQARSWDLNPIHAARDSPVVASEYTRDPVAAALEFEGIRPAAEDPFLDEKEIERSFRGISRIHATPYIKELDMSEIQLETNNSTQLTYKQKKFVALEIEGIEAAPGGMQSVLHLDPAISTDSYGLAFGHNEFSKEGDQIVVIDGLLAWEPVYQADVSITDVQKAVIEIHQRRYLASISADHYASPETIQRFQEGGLVAEVEFFSNNLQMQMYSLVRSLLHEDRLVLPNDSRWKPLLYRELSRLSLVKQNKIDHPKGAGNSKDLADCVAAVCWKLAQRASMDKVLAVPTVYGRVQKKKDNNYLPNPNQLPPPMPERTNPRPLVGMQNWRNFRANR